MVHKEIIFCLMLFLLLLPVVVLGDMSSSIYSIYADSISVGGVYSTGGSYSLQDTLGDFSGGTMNSSTYIIKGGYQAMEKGSLTLTVDKDYFSLGVLNISSVKTDNVVATVDTDSTTGYSLTIGSASASPLSAVAGGQVVAGTESYGIAVSGSDSAFITDQPIATNLVLASSASAASNVTTTLTIKAAIGPATVGGSKSQSITLSASVNL